MQGIFKMWDLNIKKIFVVWYLPGMVHWRDFLKTTLPYSRSVFTKQLESNRHSPNKLSNSATQHSAFSLQITAHLVLDSALNFAKVVNESTSFICMCWLNVCVLTSISAIVCGKNNKTEKTNNIFSGQETENI